MTIQNGRDLLLKIGNAAETESFSTIGAARTVAMTLNNAPVDATVMDDSGVQVLAADAGIQSMQIRLEGLFKDAVAEETLRTVAFDRSLRNYRMVFPNGDSYTAAFVIENYNRSGSHDGLESFSVTLLRSGTGSYAAAEA